MEVHMEVDSLNLDELFKAAARGKPSPFRSLSGDSLHKVSSLQNEDGRSLLHVAVASGLPEVVSILAGADRSKSTVNREDDRGWTPLHSAVSSGYTEIVEILLKGGADVNMANAAGGRTALHYAASRDRLKIAEILMSYGAKLNLKDKFGCTPLHRAASTGHYGLCELLIENGDEIDAVDRAGETPLMSAVICDNKKVALPLVRHGANVDIEDKEGYTVLDRASDDFSSDLIDAAKEMLEGRAMLSAPVKSLYVRRRDETNTLSAQQV